MSLDQEMRERSRQEAFAFGVVMALFVLLAVWQWVWPAVFPSAEEREAIYAANRQKQRELIDWCLSRGGTATVNRYGGFGGCTIPPRAN
jgi:hypothetical protein